MNVSRLSAPSLCYGIGGKVNRVSVRTRQPRKPFTYVENGVYENVNTVFPGNPTSRKKLVSSSPASAYSPFMHKFAKIPLIAKSTNDGAEARRLEFTRS